MNASSMLLFLAVDVLLVLTPGPDWLYVIARSLSERGWRLGLVAVSGICTAYVCYTVLVATGLATAMVAVPGVLPVLRYAGAAYLVLLAAIMLRGAHHSRTTLADDAATPPSSQPEPCRPADAAATTPRPLQVFGQSFLTGFLNPKALLLFLSLLPQFADPTAGLPVGAQLAVLGLLHVACCAGGYAAVAVMAGQVGRRVAGSTRLSRGLPFVSAALLLAVAGLSVV